MYVTNVDVKLERPERRPFLRRGVGLTRFNLPPDPAQQPSQAKRSHSHPRLSDIQSRLTQVGNVEKKLEISRFLGNSIIFIKKVTSNQEECVKKSRCAKEKASCNISHFTEK